jgi:hypothetical protein
MTSNSKSIPSCQPPDAYSKSKALEGLPAKFVAAMRTLFDILDEEKSGFILLADFEMYMRKEREEEGGGVPLGVVESLRYPVLNLQTSDVPIASLFSHSWIRDPKQWIRIFHVNDNFSRKIRLTTCEQR